MYNITVYYTYGSMYSRNGSDVPYIQYVHVIQYQQQILKASKFVRGSFRHNANYLLEKNTETFEESGSGCLTRSHKVQFCSYLTN